MRRSLSSPAWSNHAKRHRLLLFSFPLIAILLSLAVFGPLPSVEAADFTFIATQDNWVESNNPTLNFGLAPLFVDCCDDAGAVGKSRSLVQFDVSTAVGQTVVSAELRLFLAGFGATTRTNCIAQIGASWGELTSTWSNQPGLTALPGTCISVPDTQGFYSFDATTFVVGWLDGSVTNNGLRVFDAQEDVGPLSAVRQYGSRESGTPSARPALLVTTQEAVDYEVFIDGRLSVVSVEANLSHDFKVIIENEGNAVIDEVTLELFNETNVTVTTGVVQNLPVGGSATEVLRASANDIPTILGDYEFWGIKGNFTNGTGTPTDDVIRFYNFTLRVVSEGGLIFSFRIINVDLFDDVLGIGGVTTLEVDILNQGTTDLFVEIFFNTDPTITISPDRLTPDAITAGETVRFDFAVFVGAIGTFPITVRVEPTDALGANLGPIQNFQLSIRVSEVAGVITQDPDDVGPNDAILQGTITSLGEFRSALVFFIIWKTDVVEACTSTPTPNCARTPPFGSTVTFVSSFRLFVKNLEADTNYSYEFRLQFPGGEALGGVVNFRTPEGFDDPLTAMRNGIGQMIGLDAFTMGAILGMFLLFGTIVLVSLIGGEPNPIVLGVAGIAAAGVNMMLGFWPDWLFIIIAIIVAAIILRMLPFGGESPV